jgi:O-antigen biosynthesis protein
VNNLPTVSVVVPVYQRDPLLYLSLEAHRAAIEQVDGELIVVVNGFAEGLANEISSLLSATSAKIVQVPYNSGFSGGCNLGAAASTSKYVVFSNDDFLPHVDWLARLIERAESMGGDVIVGSTVVGVNGLVLDGAGNLGEDCSVSPRDRDRRYGHVARDAATLVPFVTGCGLLINRSMFRDLNGFDLIFAPAYFEDVDLCLRARTAGCAVVHEPSAWGIHREGLSHHQEARSPSFDRSRNRFTDRWLHDLGSVPSPLAQSHRTTWRILVFDDRVPSPALGSGFSRMLREIETLSQDVDFDVDYLPFLWNDATSVDMSALPGVPLVTFERALQKTRDGIYSLVLISRPHNMDRGRRLIRAARDSLVPVIYDAEALFHRRVDALLSQGRVTQAEANTARETDRQAVARADAVITVTELEATIVRSWRPEISVVACLPAASDPKEFRVRGPFVPSASVLASWLDGESSPNVDVARSMMTEVLPTVLTSLPGYVLRFSGSQPPTSLLKLATDSVEFVGTVALSDFFQYGSVSVCANTHIAGVSMKLLDSLAEGVPTVSSPECAATLPSDLAERLRVARNPGELARHLTELAEESVWMASAQLSSEIARELAARRVSISSAIRTICEHSKVFRQTSARLSSLDSVRRGAPISIADTIMAESPATEAMAVPYQDLAASLIEAQSRLSAIENSEIWKLTKPVRSTVDAVRRRSPRADAMVRASGAAQFLRKALRAPTK